MAREYGAEFPERPLMSTLSDLLGIPHFSTSRGSTVRRDFLEAVAHGLGLTAAGHDKDALIALIWSTARGEPMPADRWSPGSTVTNQVLQEIVDGLIHRGVGGRSAPPPPVDEMLAVDVALVDELAAVFDPVNLGDERSRRLVEQAQREGQDTFRTAVLAAYQGTCAVTGTQVPSVLQAAHIAPYRGRQFNVVPNGLCLRADVHVLFDRGAIAIRETDLRVLVKPHLAGSPYWEMRGRQLFAPRAGRDRPSVPALRAHRLWAGLLD